MVYVYHAFSFKWNNNLFQAEKQENVTTPQADNALHDKVMNEPAQIRKRLVKKMLKHKLADASADRQPEVAASTSGKKMRMSTDSATSMVLGSPLGENVCNMEFPLDLNNVVNMGGPICQVEDDGMQLFEEIGEKEEEQAASGNLPNFGLLE